METAHHLRMLQGHSSGRHATGHTTSTLGDLLLPLIPDADDAVALIICEGRVIYATPSVYVIPGYSPDRLKGVDRMDLVQPDHHAIIAGNQAAGRAAEGANLHAQTRRPRPDGPD